VQHRDARAESLGFVQVVRRDQHGFAFRLVLHQSLNLPPRARIDARGGLIQHDVRRVSRERQRDAESTTHTAAQRARARAFLGAKLHLPKQRVALRLQVLSSPRTSYS
jgi:hypothetical protein